MRLFFRDRNKDNHMHFLIYSALKYNETEVLKMMNSMLPKRYLKKFGRKNGYRVENFSQINFSKYCKQYCSEEAKSKFLRNQEIKIEC